MNRSFASLLCLCLLPLVSCAAPTGNLRDLEVSYLKAAVAPDVIEFAHIEIPGLEHIRIAGDPAKPYLGLRTFGGQKLKNNGVRAEVSIDYPFAAGDTVTYSWRFMIDQSFVSDAPRNRWWVFADWHDQPDRNRGETWDGFPSRSAPIGIGYGVIDGEDRLALFYGSPTSSTVGMAGFKRGVWHAVKMVISWGHGPEARARLYLDDMATPKVEAKGANMHNDFQHFFKVGSYRHREIQGDTWVYLSDVRITR